MNIGLHHFCNRGFFNGPYCPIYGFGAVLDIVLLGWIQNSVWLFLLGAIVSCTLEYITSYGLEKIFQERWWDYSEMIVQLNGRICLIGAIVFGIFSVLLNRFVHPVIVQYTEQLSPFVLHGLFGILMIGFLLDCMLTLNDKFRLDKKLKEVSVLFGSF